MLLMFSVVLPVLVNVTDFAADVTPTTTLPHAKDAGDTVTLGPPPPLVTVRLTVVVAVRLPDVPVMVTADVPKAAVALAVRVNVLVVVVGFGLNPAATPLGRPEAPNVTLPVKPLCGTTVIAVVPLLPCASLRELGLAVKLKPVPGTTSTTTGFDSMPLATATTL